MFDGGLAQLEERVVSNDEAPGSKPGFSNPIIVLFINFVLPLWLSWQSERLLTVRSPVRARAEAMEDFLIFVAIMFTNTIGSMV